VHGGGATPRLATDGLPSTPLPRSHRHECVHCHCPEAGAHRLAVGNTQRQSQLIGISYFDAPLGVASQQVAWQQVQVLLCLYEEAERVVTLYMAII
jgi:hypothetical protein